MKKYTIFYVVGGEQKYYDQLLLSIQSVYKYMPVGEFKIKILDLGARLASHREAEVVTFENQITEKHIFWKYKYYICQQLDTEYGLYLDCDTVMCSDRVEEFFKETKGKFGVIKHFDIKCFESVPHKFNSEEARAFDFKYNVKWYNQFYTGGVFFFHRTDECMEILKKTFEFHDNYYPTEKEPYIEGMYDETFLSTVLTDYVPVSLSGSANHCSANHMPLEIINKKLYGSNPGEQREEIFILHGSSDRQKLGLDFSGELRQTIIRKWNP